MQVKRIKTASSIRDTAMIVLRYEELWHAASSVTSTKHKDLPLAVNETRTNLAQRRGHFHGIRHDRTPKSKRNLVSSFGVDADQSLEGPGAASEPSYIRPRSMKWQTASKMSRHSSWCDALEGTYVESAMVFTQPNFTNNHCAS